MAKLLTAKAMEKLKEIAKNLPDIQQKKRIVRTGKDLLRSGIMKDQQGNDVKRSSKYVFFEYANVDHLERLKKIYVEQGEDAVTRYAGEAVRLHARVQSELRAKQEQKKTEKVI